MRDLLSINRTGRLKFRHLLCLTMAISSLTSWAQEENIFNKFNPTVKIQSRGPGSFIADIDYVQAPQRKKILLEKVFVEDQAGVLRKIKSDLYSWEKNEEYIKNWDMYNFGSYTVVEADSKKNYLSKRLLKYVDKRLSGEVKKAKKGSTLAAVGNAQKALKPNTKVSISENVKLKFKARVLQGEAIMKVVNPYVKYNTTLSVSDGVVMKMSKDIKSFRALASVEYRPTDSNYMARFNKRITDSLNMDITSSQNHGHAIFTSDSDSKFQLNYSIPYEF